MMVVGFSNTIYLEVEQTILQWMITKKSNNFWKSSKIHILMNKIGIVKEIRKNVKTLLSTINEFKPRSKGDKSRKYKL